MRAIRAANGDGRASASSKELVWSDWVPPSTPASASMVVRTMLLCGSCSVSDTPEVWQWVRSASELGDVAPNLSRISVAHRKRAARSFAISMKKFMPRQKKNERRGANSSIFKPLPKAARTYSRPSARVKASSCTQVAPASCM